MPRSKWTWPSTVPESERRPRGRSGQPPRPPRPEPLPEPAPPQEDEPPRRRRVTDHDVEEQYRVLDAVRRGEGRPDAPLRRREPRTEEQWAEMDRQAAAEIPVDQHDFAVEVDDGPSGPEPTPAPTDPWERGAGVTYSKDLVRDRLEFAEMTPQEVSEGPGRRPDRRITGTKDPLDSLLRTVAPYEAFPSHVKKWLKEQDALDRAQRRGGPAPQYDRAEIYADFLTQLARRGIVLEAGESAWSKLPPRILLDLAEDYECSIQTIRRAIEWAEGKLPALERAVFPKSAQPVEKS